MKLTIITAVLNQKNNIKKTVKSVLRQNFTEFEYCIIDGFSNDGTYEYLVSLNDERINLFQLAPSGLYSALNYGIKKSSGEFIMILNAGDIYLSDDVFSSYFKSGSGYNEILYSKLQYLDYELKAFSETKEVHLKSNFMMEGCDVPHPTTFISRKLYEKYQYYDESLVSMADYDLLLKLHSNGHKFKFVDLVSVAFFPAGISSNQYIILKESCKVRMRYLSFFKSFFYSFRSIFFILMGNIIIKIFGKKRFSQIQKFKRTLF